MNKDLKFLVKNIFRPEGKISIQLGNDIGAKRYLNYFNQKSWKRGFIKNKKYNISLLPISSYQNPEEYLLSVNGKNSAYYFSRRCEKMGYSFKPFDPNSKIDAIYAINMSADERQGRKMDEAYRTKVLEWPSDEANIWYGIFSSDQELVGYVWTVNIGELTIINRILGHQAHLKNNVMYSLVTNVIGKAIEEKLVRYIMYDTFGRKQNGLVLFKKRIGFKPYTVNFIP